MSTPEQHDWIVENNGERLDKLIASQLGDQLSRAQIQNLIRDGLVTVDDKIVKPGAKLKSGAHIHLTIPPVEENDTVEPEEIPLTVVYDDEHIAVIDKPAGMVVHPGDGNETGTLVAAILARWPEIALMDSEKRMGIVHRLDKDTSGLIVIAKNDVARRRLMAQFQERTVDKTYIGLTESRPKEDHARIELPLGRDANNRKRMAVVRGGKVAITEFTVIDDAFQEGRALLKIKLHTGRTHQIRVHLAYIGAPLVGDPLYGRRKQRIKLKRQFLHAAELSFDHPETGERLSFESPLPTGLQNILDKLRA